MSKKFKIILTMVFMAALPFCVKASENLDSKEMQDDYISSLFNFAEPKQTENDKRAEELMTLYKRIWAERKLLEKDKKFKAIFDDFDDKRKNNIFDKSILDKIDEASGSEFYSVFKLIGQEEQPNEITESILRFKYFKLQSIINPPSEKNLISEENLKNLVYYYYSPTSQLNKDNYIDNYLKNDSQAKDLEGKFETKKKMIVSYLNETDGEFKKETCNIIYTFINFLEEIQNYKKEIDDNIKRYNDLRKVIDKALAEGTFTDNPINKENPDYLKTDYKFFDNFKSYYFELMKCVKNLVGSEKQIIKLKKKFVAFIDSCKKQPNDFINDNDIF